jgi:hypothetical protein
VLGGSADGQPLREAHGSTSLTGTVYLSRTAPAMPTVTAPAVSTSTSATTSFGISWGSAGAPAGTTYTVRSSVDGGAFTALRTNTTTTSMTVSAGAGQTRRFSVTATDPAGRASVAGTATTVVPHDDAAGAYAGPWSTLTAANRYLGAIRQSGTAGSTVTFGATGNVIRLVGDKGPSNGRFQVSYDGGAFSAPIDTLASSPLVRQVLTTQSFSGAPAMHTVRVRVVGTAGRPTVAVDGAAYTR